MKIENYMRTKSTNSLFRDVVLGEHVCCWETVSLFFCVYAEFNHEHKIKNIMRRTNERG